MNKPHASTIPTHQHIRQIGTPYEHMADCCGNWPRLAGCTAGQTTYPLKADDTYDGNLPHRWRAR